MHPSRLKRLGCYAPIITRPAMLLQGQGFPTSRDAIQCGAYLVHHISGMTYVGASADLYQRKLRHTSALGLGNHHCVRLQQLFNQDNRVEYVCYPTSTMEEAMALEQKLAYDLNASGLLLNASLNTVAPFKGMTHSPEVRSRLSAAASSRTVSEEQKLKVSQSLKGRPVSQVTRQKLSEIKTGVARPDHVRDLLNTANLAKSRKVVVDGVVYESEAAAGRAFGVDTKTVRNRIASKTDRFTGWNHSQD